MFEKPKRVKLSTVRGKADKWFARYIRLRGTQEQRGKRIGVCVTCNRPKNIWKLECGHFMGRRWDPTRWDDINSHLQCKTCNCYNSGEQYIMGKYIERMYGSNVVELLRTNSRRNVRFAKYEVEAIYMKYKKKCEEIVGMELNDKRWNELLHSWK
jgi:hypothetical protein